MRMFFAALLAIVATGASAHDFYSQQCCSENDCHPQKVDSEFVTLTKTGWSVVIPSAGIDEFLPFDDERIRDTPVNEPAAFHVCINWQKKLLCLYRPGAAG